MKVGDLVKYKNTRYEAWKQVGIILRCIPGSDRRKVVQWNDGTRSSYAHYQLELVK